MATGKDGASQGPEKRVSIQTPTHTAPVNRGHFCAPQNRVSASDSNQSSPLRRSGTRHSGAAGKSTIVDAKARSITRRTRNEDLAPKPGPALEVSRWVVDPRTSNAVVPWDSVVVSALIFTAMVTPFEVAFLGPPTEWGDGLFIINRVIDVIFIGDVVLQFFLIQSVSDTNGDRWITDHRMLIGMYLRGWFLPDIVSIAASSLDFIAITSSDSDLRQFKILRVVRVLRLIKLLRLVRTSRLIKRWETKIRINYALLSVLRIIISLCLCTHWSACLFTLMSSFTMDTPKNTWLAASGYCVENSALLSGGLPYGIDQYSQPAPQGADTGWSCMSPWAIYAAATYWAAMTITSIGYGDIAATPGNSAEQACATLLMLSGAMLWGQVVATFCSVVSSIQASDMAFRATLDNLNDFMASEALPQKLQWRLREFFFRTKHLRVARANSAIVKQMSPGLQAETIAATAHRWLKNVRFLSSCDPGFIAQVVLELRPMVFTPEDVILPEFEELFVIHRGVCLYGGKVLQAGAVWGEDMLLENEALRSTNCSKALTYLETNSIGRDRVYAIAGRYPDSYARLRRFVGFLALHRQIVLLARLERGMRHRHGLQRQRTQALNNYFTTSRPGSGGAPRERRADPDSVAALTLGDQVKSVAAIKRLGRTDILSGYYAAAAGYPTGIFARDASAREAMGARQHDAATRLLKLSGGQQPPPPQQQPPRRAAGGGSPASAMLMSMSGAHDDELAPLAQPTASTFSVRPRSAGAQWDGMGEVVKLDKRGSPMLTASDGSGEGEALQRPPRLRKNRLHAARPSAAPTPSQMEELRAELRDELRAGLAAQASLIEAGFARLRAELSGAPLAPTPPGVACAQPLSAGAAPGCTISAERRLDA